MAPPRDQHLDLEPDQDGYVAARDRLTERFARWAGTRGKPAERGIADLFCDFAHGYAHGHLGSWHVDDVHELLDDWFLRKVNVDGEDLDRVVPTLVAFLAFLDDEGLFAPGSDPPKRLRRVAAQHEHSFPESMRDPARFGPAKALFTQMVSEGVDATDEAAMARWMDDFNARSFDERDEVLGPALDGDDDDEDEPLSLPPVVLPSPDEIAASAATAPILERFRRLVAFVGDGRKLTSKGNFTLADGKALVALLGTGDEVDEEWRGQTIRTRSSADLPQLDLTFQWAKAARILRVQKGRLVSTKRGRAIDGDPLGVFQRALQELFRMGPLGAIRGYAEWLEQLDAGVVEFLVGLLGAGEPVAFDTIAESEWQDFRPQLFMPDGLDDENAATLERAFHDWFVHDVSDLFALLELAGVVVREGDERVPDRYGSEHRAGGALSLTPVGREVAHGFARLLGYDAPLAGELVDADAGTLLGRCAEMDIDEAGAELAVWCAPREPASAARELADAARAGDFDMQLMAFAGFETIGDAAEPAVRTLVDDPETRGPALFWLVQRGFEDRDALQGELSMDLMVEAFASFLRADGPEAVIAELHDLGPADEQRVVIEQIWRCQSSQTVAVLEAIAAHHPDKTVAKAARKALFQHRSAAGSDGRGSSGS